MILERNCALSRRSRGYSSETSELTHCLGCRISLAHRTATPVKLGPKDTLRLTFQVVDKEDGKGVQPHQTFLRFYDEATGEEGIQPVKVSANGKAKFDLVRPQNYIHVAQKY